MESKKIITWASITAGIALLWWMLKPRPASNRRRGTIREVFQAAIISKSTSDWVDYARIAPEEAADIQSRTETRHDFSGWSRVLTASDIRHILQGHGHDTPPITRQHFDRLPDLLANPISQHIKKRPGKLDCLVSVINSGGKLLIIEEVRRGRRKLAIKTIYYSKK
jgi:hypothetical protein